MTTTTMTRMEEEDNDEDGETVRGREEDQGSQVEHIESRRKSAMRENLSRLQ